MIHVLPPHIASQIAAGEVVQRPASVVKELLENAVDSGADTIQLVLIDAGSTLMQVVDNGCGMSPQDAMLAFKRHATSKITNIDDLQSIHTFGFRGEALASISSIAHVRMRTRREQDEWGTEVTIAGDQTLSQEEVACPAGTDISVRNLFFNVPARRKFLKSEAVEFKHIQAEFQRVALCWPDRTFILSHNGAELFHLSTADNWKQRIVQALGKELNSQLVDIHVNTEMIRINGFVSHPQYAKKSGNFRFFFINGRFFNSPYLHKAVLNAYQKLLPEDRVPSYFIYMETDPGNIDINIHPSKTEVKFEDELVVFQMLQAVIRESLGRFSLAMSIDFDTNGFQNNIPLPPVRGEYVPSPKPNYDPLFNPFSLSETPRQTDTQATFEYALHENLQPPAKAIISLQKKYLITSVKSGLLVINKRRAWERIIFEKMMDKWDGQSFPSQKLLFPVALKLQPDLVMMALQYQADLLHIGFSVESSDPSSLTVLGTPLDHPTDETSLLQTLTCLLETSPQPSQLDSPWSPASLAATIASNMARIEEEETAGEQQALIDRLFACKEPQMTALGQSCFVTISVQQIDKLFS